MASDPAVTLTARQRELLALVIEEYVATGQPVGSRHLVERGELRVSPSTVRNELSVETMVYVVSLVPQGVARRIDEQAPGNCPPDIR